MTERNWTANKSGKKPLKAVVAGAGVAMFSATMLTGCGMQMAEEEPRGDKPTVRLAMPDASSDNPIDSELVDGVRVAYEEAVDKAEYPVEIETVPAKDRLESVFSGEADVTVGCVGELLEETDAHAADRLKAEYAAQKEHDSVTWRDAVHSTLLGTLPGGYTLSNPGIAQICDNESLPQNAVAVYRSESLDRKGVLMLNNVAGGTSADGFKDKAKK